MNALSAWLDRNSLYIALLAAWIATLGSLYFSEVAGFVPCTLCWYQRILMYPLSLLLALGLWRQDANLPILVLPFSLLGLCFSTYHYLLEKTHLFTSHGVCQAGVSCTTAWINWFGFVTIPFLALVGFLIISVNAAIALNAGEPDPSEERATPWRPVALIVGATVLAFGLLAWINWPTTTSAATPLFPVTEASAVEFQSKATTPGADAELVARGARLYAMACAACHGVGGAGIAQLGGPLVGAEGIGNRSDADLLALIRAGVPVGDPRNQSSTAMPPSGGRPDLTDDELLAIIYYLRANS